MVFLPVARPSYLKSFSIAIGILIGGALGGFLMLLRTQHAWSFSLLVFLTISLVGIGRPTAMVLLYRTWNRLARYFVRCARLLLIATCFYIVLLTVGRTGKNADQLRLRPTESLWIDKTPDFSAISGHEFLTREAFQSASWLHGYFQWAKASNQIWALVLVPFLALLGRLEVTVDQRVPSGVYTLF